MLSLASLFSATQEIVGFFIIETHVLSTTGSFRSEREVEELWDALLKRLTSAVENALSRETDADSYLRVKESLIGFVMTLEVRSDCQNSSHPTHALVSVVLVLYEQSAVFHSCSLRALRQPLGEAIRQAV